MGFPVILLSLHRHCQESITWERLSCGSDPCSLWMLGVICCGGRAGTWGCKGLSIACHGDKQGRGKSGTGNGCSGSGWFQDYCFEQKRWGSAQTGLQEALSCVCSCAGTCRTGRGFIQKCLFHSPVFTITTPAAVVPGVKGEAVSLLAACTGVFTRCVYTHKPVHREAGGSGCAVVPAGAGSWQCACCGDRCHGWPQGHLCSLLVVLNPCHVHPASCRAGLEVGSKPTTGSCLV